MSPQDSPANSLPTPPTSETATSPDEPALNCTQPAGGVVVPEPSTQRDDSTTTAVAISVEFDDSSETIGITNTESTPRRECADLVNTENPEARGREDMHPVLQDGTTPGSEPTGSSETPNEGTELVESEDEATPEPEPPKLVLPRWFLENNVMLSETFRASHSPLGVFDPDVKEAEITTNTGTSDDKATPMDYEIHQSIYDEVQDQVFSGMQLTNKSNPPSGAWVDTAAFLLQSPRKGTLDFLDAVVHRLARDFDADLVSVNREDLEDVCHDFWSHTADNVSPEKYLSSPHRFVTKYFDRHASYTDEVQNAVETIVAGSRTKRAETVVGVAADAELEKRHPVIVLLRDIEVYEQATPFSRFYEVVKARRSEGFPILILATAVSSSTAEYKQRTFVMDRVWEGLCLNSSKIVNISPRRTKRSVEAIRRNIEHARPLERWRQLRRALRHTLEPEITRDIFLPQTEWPISGTGELQQTVEEWDDAMAARVIRQICTRARRTSTLALGDITEVLARTSRNMAIFNESNDDESALEDSKDDMKSKRLLLLDSISPQCSDDEKEFFDCVIDMDSLTAATQSIRVDGDLFDSLEQLLSLRVHKSYGLLAQESVNGAILYGPPGTGKTHLARVVAKSADANLIVATPADIQSCWVGETEKRIKALFSLASKLAPSIIFLDEGDALFTRRQAGDKDWTRKAMSQFLMEMDGLCKQDQPPFLLVATNRPGDIDDAICRRLPHMLHVGMPSTEDRRAILDIYLKEEQVGDVDLDALAATGTKGFSGSDIRTLCIQAAMAAQREIDVAKRKGPGENMDEVPRRMMTMSHFKIALSRTRPSVTRESLLEIQKFESQQRKCR